MKILSTLVQITLSLRLNGVKYFISTMFHIIFIFLDLIKIIVKKLYFILEGYGEQYFKNEF